MGLIVASAANDRVVLGFADSDADATAQITPLTAAGQPAGQRALWTGATYEAALTLPAGWGQIQDYYMKVVGGVKSIESIASQYPLRNGFRAWHLRLHELSDLLRAVGADYPQWAVNIGHDMLFNMHRGAYMVWNDARLTAAHKGQWLQLSALGPNDASGGVALYDRERPETIFPILAALWEAADSTARGTIQSGVTNPMSVVQVVNESGDVAIARRTLAAMINDTAWFGRAVPPTVAQLNAGRWIDAINA